MEQLILQRNDTRNKNEKCEAKLDYLPKMIFLYKYSETFAGSEKEIPWKYAI